MFNINPRSRSAEFIYTPLLTLSIFSISPRSISDVLNYLLGLPSKFNINPRSRSEEQNYLHGWTQYVQYQPTFKICGTNLYTSAYPQCIHSQPTFGIWCTKVFTRIALFIFNINLRSRSEEQNYLHGCSQYVQYQPTFKICGIYL